MDIEEAYNVGFNLVEMDIVSKVTGFPSKTNVFINKDDLEFEFVAETSAGGNAVKSTFVRDNRSPPGT
ncbi:hypothetical protein [Sporosarcina koreensis]|uniref:Uncharacterized protein n=1 Tax=Sporosarcina koreensis TaxID=334735 RepID=A0ABW0TWN8_9BACL